MFFFAKNVIEMPLATMKPRKAIHNPWLAYTGVRTYHIGRKTSIAEIIIVLRMALEAVAPMYMPSQRNAAKVMMGMSAIYI